MLQFVWIKGKQTSGGGTPGLLQGSPRVSTPESHDELISRRLGNVFI